MPTRIHLKDGRTIAVAESIPDLDRASDILRATQLQTGEPVAILRSEVDTLEWEPR